MSEHKIVTTTRTCDQCKKEVVGNDLAYGNHPFQGWFRLTQQGESIFVSMKEGKLKWDFCSNPCLSKWLQSPNKEGLPVICLHDFRGGDGAPCKFCGLTITELLDEGKL